MRWPPDPRAAIDLGVSAPVRPSALVSGRLRLLCGRVRKFALVAEKPARA
jgi:hypothetical protein